MGILVVQGGREHPDNPVYRANVLEMAGPIYDRGDEVVEIGALATGSGSSSASASGSGSGSGASGVCPSDAFCEDVCTDTLFVYEACEDLTHTMIDGHLCHWQQEVMSDYLIFLDCHVDAGVAYWDLFLLQWAAAKWNPSCWWYKATDSGDCPPGNYTRWTAIECCDATVTVYT